MFSQLHNVPEELRSYPQWVVWRYEDRDGPKPTKVPYDPKTGNLASVADPNTWASFDTVVSALTSGHWNGAGFVLTERDPFTFIDLDDTEGDQAALKVQLRVFDAFNSYAERSPSGKGLHIICKGHVATGRRRGKIEVYSEGRYMTMTGEVFHNAPIAERQSLVNTLWSELGGGAKANAYTGTLEQKESDEEIIDKASRAVNGEKFVKLLNGDWQGDYPSQSEADQAFINFLAFYTQNPIQITRMFRASPLGQREKAKRNGYVNFTINRAFDRMLPPIDFDGIKNQLADALAANAPAPVGTGPAIDLSSQIARALATVAPAPAPVYQLPPQPTYTQPARLPAHTPVPFPPGLLGDIAQFIYEAAPRPVREIALAGAIGLMAGVCGRAYNVSATGLNQYVLLLAPTGTGKEAMASGVERLMTYVQRGGLTQEAGLAAMPAVREFIGPAEISSGQALVKYIGKARSFVSIVGEFGLTMQRLSHPRASSSEIQLKKMLLDLFNKSGHGNVLRPTIYSDKEKNTDDVMSPALTILGESTPETYYANVDETLIADGLLPRFLAIEYTGPRPALNEGHAHVVPSLELIKGFSDLCDNSLKLNSHNSVINCEFTAEARAFAEWVETFTTDQINAPDQRDVFRHLWNRAHIKTLKLAALAAVGQYANAVPVVDLPTIQWAWSIVVVGVQSIVTRFDSGEVGTRSEEGKQAADVCRVIWQYVSQPYDTVAKYDVPRAMHNEHVVPYSYIQRRLVAAAAFRADRTGATNAIKRTIQTLLDAGDIQELGRADLATKFNGRGRAFVVANPNRFVAGK